MAGRTRVDRLEPSGHACRMFTGPEERLDPLADGDTGRPTSRHTVVVCPEPVSRTLTVAGAAGVPNLRIVVRHGER